MAFACLLPIALPLATQSVGPVSQRSPERAPASYVRQLGSLHFPGGQAAFVDTARALVVLPSGAVVVAGETRGSLGEQRAGSESDEPHVFDIFVARFDRDGDLMWVSQVGGRTGPTIPLLNGDAGGPGGDATARESVDDLAVAADGSLFVTGKTLGSLGETNGGGSDAFLAKFDRAGNLLWLRQLGIETAAAIVPPSGASEWGDVSDWEQNVHVAVDPEGGAWIAGDTPRALGEDVAKPLSSERDVFVARYDADGNFEWLRQLGVVSSPAIGFDPLHDERVADLALLPSGRLVVAVSRAIFDWDFYLYYYDALAFAFEGSGQPVGWTNPSDSTEFAGPLAVDEHSGHVYLAGTTIGSLAEQNTGSGLDRDAFVVRMDANLTPLWVSQIGAATAARLGLADTSESEFVGGLALDRFGNPILSGTTSGALNESNAGAGDLFTAKFRALDGQPRWVSQIGQSTAKSLGLDASEQQTARAVGVHAAGTISVCGSTVGDLVEPSGGERDVLVLRLDHRGELE